jgi:hypothetical protein
MTEENVAKRIIEDEREIAYIWKGEASWTVGEWGITKIEPYDESGQMACVTWFALWAGDVIKARINAAQIEGVGYKRTD